MTDGAFKIWFDEEAEISAAAFESLKTRPFGPGELIITVGASDYEHNAESTRRMIADAYRIPAEIVATIGRPLILPDVDRLRIEAERAGIDYVMSEDVPRAFTIRNVEPLELDGLKLPRNRAERRRMAKTGSRG